MTTTNSQFVSKEHYIAFRKAWAAAVNSDKAKEHTEVRTSTWKGSVEEYTVTVDGWLTSAHHVLYNILRGKPFHYGFTMISNANKLRNGTSPQLGLEQAVRELKHIQKLIKEEEEHTDPVKNEARKKRLSDLFRRKPEVVDKPFYGTSIIDEFLAPFDGTIDRAILKAVKVPTVKPMYVTYGKDKKVVDKMLADGKPVITYDELQALYEVA